MSRRAAVIGAGPAGLMAAERLAAAGHAVTVYDQMPSPGRKFLMAGRGGLNLTHSEPLPHVLRRYGAAEARLTPIVTAFPPDALRDWAEGLGQPCFTGSSGRVFPRAMKASPLLRAWLARLAEAGVRFALRHHWEGWTGEGLLAFADSPPVPAEAVVLALGGASWPRLGSDGGWAGHLGPVVPFRPSNMGVTLPWSDYLRTHFAGQPVKSVLLHHGAESAPGDLMLSGYGLEGGPVYALSAGIRDRIAETGEALLSLDLRPGMSEAEVAARLGKLRPRDSLATGLRRALALAPAAVALLHEVARHPPRDPAALAGLIKALPLRATGVQGLDRAISSAGGLAWEAVDETLMLRARAGVFAAGEMLDWEAPTGGYLLQACMATGRWAGDAAAAFLARP